MASVNNSSSPVLPEVCISDRTAHVFTAWFLLYMLCLPVFLSALYVLYRKWKSPRPLSHSDIFTVHLLMMEVVNLLGACLALYSFYKNVSISTLLSTVLTFSTRTGRIYINNLTCVDRYVAVVHPIMYMRLKKGAGVMVRNVCIGLSWLINAGISCIMHDISFIIYYEIITLAIAVMSFLLMSFCTASVFCVLIGPGPGEGGGDRKSTHQTKRTALHTMSFILGAQMLNIVNTITFYTIGMVPISGADLCFLSVNSMWLEFPNSLVLPLLFLNRAKKQL